MSPPPLPPAPDFWSFSLDFYGRPGVVDTCLELQDRHGLDVNLVLYCCWRGDILAQGQIQAAIDLTAPWRTEVVQPLRALRRRLKPGFPPFPDAEALALRKRIADAELEAERLQQQALDALARNEGPISLPSRQAAAANLMLLAAFCQAGDSTGALEQLAGHLD
ncbi:MAG: TIGR02444 family protein [Oceanibaculum nanhaiense]|uniref:TIGR02444 family protein n=1 Tax=Oceanibaculum nanhaiense TaxID=1909734 RepID=UPI0025A3DE0E|nr:TIGR02444 family protein [Oceanibaculum nanhaiense]MDM7946099.1 TIGR02444 family protein [Oceanibaculum nanhaiense]